MRSLRALTNAGIDTAITMTRMITLISASIEYSAVDGLGPGSSSAPRLNFPESLILRLKISRELEPSTMMVLKKIAPL
jgi:hypothetical protein